MLVSTHHRVHLALGLHSGAIIAYQLVLMQIFSYLQWHHFASMIISVALLGFGAAGTVLALFRKFLLNHYRIILPLSMIFSGACMTACTTLSQLAGIRFDSFILFSGTGQSLQLLYTCCLLFLPFFSGAVSIGMIFVREVGKIGKIYFSNLLGSGIGGFFILLLFWVIHPALLPALISLFPILAALLLLSSKGRWILLIAAFLSSILIVSHLFNPPALQASQFKDISYALNLPESSIEYEQPSPYGLIEVVQSPGLRFAPGLSLNYNQAVPPQMGVYVNGHGYGAITPWNRADSTVLTDYSTMALPYVMARRPKVLVLDAATGTGVAQGLTRNASLVTAVEANKEVISLLRNELAGRIDSIWDQPAVHVKIMHPRSWLIRDTAQYDLIQLPLLASFGGNSGLDALEEQYLFTREAFREMWQKLRPEGVIAVSTWLDYPSRYPLRILSSLVGHLSVEGISQPGMHIAAIYSWGTITFVLKKSPISHFEQEKIRTFCERMSFDPALLPDIREDERAQYNALQDEGFFSLMDRMMNTTDLSSLCADYDFRINPTTDDRPYFSQFIRLGRMEQVIKSYGEQGLPFFELGYIILLLALLQISVLAFLLILLPLFRLGFRGGDRSNILLYFGGIGLGYMFIEMGLIQRFVLYFGHTIFSTSAGISSLLIFSGLGSYLSREIQWLKTRAKYAPAMVAGLLLIYTGLLSPFMQATIGFPEGFKIALFLIILAPLGFSMGIPFPNGLARLEKSGAKLIPWAWGINGCLSVVSAVLATVVAVECGNTTVMATACLAYAMVFIVSFRWGI